MSNQSEIEQKIKCLNVNYEYLRKKFLATFVSVVPEYVQTRVIRRPFTLFQNNTLDSLLGLHFRRGLYTSHPLGAASPGDVRGDLEITGDL